jgi:hypothetical protein
MAKSSKVDEKRKNPAAVALSKLGASKGGKARAARLSAKRRREIAVKAITARWNKVERRGVESTITKSR